MYLILPVVAALLVTPASAYYRLIVTDTNLPEGACDDGEVSEIATVYDGHGSIYIICSTAVLKYSVGSVPETLTPLGGPPFNIYHQTAVGVGPCDMYVFAQEYSGESEILTVWRIGVGEGSALTWNRMTELLDTSFIDGSAVWDGLDHIYVSGVGWRTDKIWKYSISGCTLTEAGSLSKRLSAAAMVWAPPHDSAFIFGGEERSGSYSYDVLKFDPAEEETPSVATLPVRFRRGRAHAVWAGSEVYLLCGGTLVGDPSYNFMWFNPATNMLDREYVYDFNFRCDEPDAVWVSDLNRVYLIGNWVDDRERQPIMYIFDGGEGGTKNVNWSTALEPCPGPTPTPTPTPTTSTTTMTTAAPAPVSTTTEKSEPDCSPLDKFRTLYEAYIGELASNPCPGISTGTATWLCLPDNTFAGPNPDYGNCSSRWLQYLVDSVQPGLPLTWSEASSLLSYLQRHLRDSANPQSNVTYFGHEIETIFRVGQHINELVENSSKVQHVELLVGRTFKAFSLVLQHSSPWEELEDRSQAGTAFLRASDGTSLDLGRRCGQEEPESGCRSSFDALPEFQAMSGAEPVPTPSSGQAPKPISFPNQYNPKSDSCIQIPSSWATHFPAYEYVTLSGLRLRQDHTAKLFPPTAMGGRLSQDGSDQGNLKTINGPLMGFTFGTNALVKQSQPQPGINFTEGERGVRIHFQHELPAWGPERAEIRRRLHPGEAPKAVAGTAVCVYWDEAALVWSADGCRLVSSKSGLTVCECSHLTAFAIIMDLHNYIGKPLALEILTWLLCSVSIVCLAITIGVLLHSRYGRGRPLLPKHPRNDLTLGLCICLLVSNVLTLTTMDKHNVHLSDGACTASAVLLHYTLLCAFAWMALEGLLLAKLVFLDVFAKGDEHAKIQRVGALLIPAIVVGTTCAVNFGRGDDGYGNDAFCWLNGAYLWSFIGVVIVIVMFNGSVLVLSIRKSYQLQSNPNPSLNSTRARRAAGRSVFFWIRGSLSLTVIMGLTWVAGFLMLVNEKTVAHIGAYLFTVTNASQGILIFVLHIASSKKVRSQFRSLAFTDKSTKSTGTRSQDKQ